LQLNSTQLNSTRPRPQDNDNRNFAPPPPFASLPLYFLPILLVGFLTYFWSYFWQTQSLFFPSAICPVEGKGCTTISIRQVQQFINKAAIG